MIDALTAGPLADTGAASADPARDARLRETARDLESAFLAEMLKQAGVAEAFGAGSATGADEFSSFLLEAVADDLSEKGGFGLAERFYERLKQTDEPQRGRTTL